MTSIPNNLSNEKGLTDEQVLESRGEFGNNRLNYKESNNFIEALQSLAKEPMVALLFITSIIYFVSGKIGDGVFLVLAILLVATISLYQDARSRNALKKLKKFTQPECKVIRNGKVVEINNEDIVIGDILIADEGSLIAADAMIISSNDFSVNESILTGEFMPVNKDQTKDDNILYKGTNVVSGLALARVIAIGNGTKFGKIGLSLLNIVEEKTPLELQISNFVKKMVIAGAIVFIIVWMINYLNTKNLIDSLLKALTLAMSILPEEIPVAFTTFMALGAWRLMKLGIVVKQMKTVETLGSATVICLDKTGTITENKMSLAKLYLHKSNQILDFSSRDNDEQKLLISTAMWASEPIPFDPMEIALHQAYQEIAAIDERNNYTMIHEYPLAGKPPMMTHIFENKMGCRILAAKGAPEAIMIACDLDEQEKILIEAAIVNLSVDGFRVLGVGLAEFKSDIFPEDQQKLPFVFIGLVAFYDPPKKNIQAVFEAFYKAGISIKIVTGDNAATTSAIAKQVGFIGYDKCISGDDLMKLSDIDLQYLVMNANVFTRMFPEAKLRIIQALKANNEIVAMTGDGVNDGPALKAAHIGIAMGKKGTEIAKEAASLILVEDDLSKMVEAIAMGRRIYTNLKKAIQYIISIHIPIILTVFLPLVFGWIYPNIFTPLHIIFLELIMGPTCSIIYENEPIEENTMLQNPRPFTNTFFNWKELTLSIIQGCLITVGTLSVYQLAVSLGYNEAITRTMVFCVLIMANIILTLVNRSFYYSALITLSYKNNLVALIIGLTLLLTALLIYVEPLTSFFGFESLSLNQVLICFGIGFLSVIWFELFKLAKRMKRLN